MQKNAWKVAHEVAAKIDDAPVHSGYMTSNLWQKGQMMGCSSTRGI